MEKQRSIGGMWENEDKNGKTYYNISLEIEGIKCKFVAFSNDYKEEGDNKPDFSIFPKRERESF